jgi:hypothetical protein
MSLKSKNGNASLSPLSDKAKQLLDKELTEKNKPVAPVAKISKSLMLMKDNRVAIRNLFLIPWIMAMFTVLYLQGEEIYGAWKAEERTILRRLDTQVKIHGPNYLLITKDQDILDYLDVIDHGKLRFDTYMKKIRYSNNFLAYPERNLHGDIFHTSVATSLILLLGTISIRMKRRAAIYFDRDEKIIYTWRFGKVWAQRYKNLGYYYNRQAMQFYLYYLDPKGKGNPLKSAQYQIQPSGNPYWNTWEEQQDVLSAVVKFMEQGQEAVWHTDWEGRKNFYFFEDKKPEDFDRQLALILQKIDEEKATEEPSQNNETNGLTV